MTDPDDLWTGRELRDDPVPDRVIGATIAIVIALSALAFWVGLAVLIVRWW